MAVPNIVAFRIDERLIHGQGQLWIKALGVNTVIVANDSASEDSMQQTLMKAVVPKTIAMRFFSIRHTCDVILKASPKQTIFIVCKTTGDALKLVAGGVPVKEINVGNIHHAPGKEEVSKYIALIIDTLNHDGSLSQILSPNERIQNVLRKYKNGEKI